jgi:hypothetical protein
MLTQFLRIRVAASMRDAAAAESTAGLRAEMVEKRTIEIAGYELSAELAGAFDAIRMNGLDLHSATHIDWFQLSPGKDDRLGAAAERVVNAWRRKGVSVSSMNVVGEQFWAVPEAPIATELISRTVRSIEACRG